MAENIELHISEPSNAPPFGKGMQVEYLSKGNWVPAEIIDVHHDDAPPYYTIYIPPDATGCGAKMCGCSCMCVCSQIREKQTVRHKLRFQSKVLEQSEPPVEKPALAAPNPTPAPKPAPKPNATPIPTVHHHHTRNFYPQVNRRRMSMVFR